MSEKCLSELIKLAEWEMSQGDHEASQQREGQKQREVLLVPDQQPTMISQPGKSSLHDPAVTVASDGPAILRVVVRAAIAAMRGDHLDAQIKEQLVERITIIGLVSDQPLRMKVLLEQIERLLDHGSLACAGRAERRANRKSMGINDDLGFRPLALSGQPNSFAATLGGGKGRVDKALPGIDAAMLNQATNDPCQKRSKGHALAPKLEVIMDGGLGRKAGRQMLPLNTGMEDKEDRLEYFSRIGAGAASGRITHDAQVRLDQLPLLVGQKHGTINLTLSNRQLFFG